MNKPKSASENLSQPEEKPKQGFFGRITKAVGNFLMARDIEEQNQESALDQELQQPIVEEIHSELAITYRGELFGMTNRKTRPSNDRSMIRAVDRGVAAAVCDGAGSEASVGQLAERVVESLSKAGDFISAQTSVEEQKEILTEAIAAAVQTFNEFDKQQFIGGDDLPATTVTAYVVASEKLVGIHAGDSELHHIAFSQQEERLIASCLSARDHHIGNNLKKSVVSWDDAFNGQYIEQAVGAGDVLVSWSDGFAKYWLDLLMIKYSRYDQDIDQLQIDNENRVGETYQKAMAELLGIINAEIIKGNNPTDRLLREAQEEAVRSTRYPHNKRGYHDDISLIITVLQ